MKFTSRNKSGQYISKGSVAGKGVEPRDKTSALSGFIKPAVKTPVKKADGKA